MHYTMPTELFKYHVVMRPHPDDEAIGCFELYKDVDYLNKQGAAIKLYTVGFDVVCRSVATTWKQVQEEYRLRDLETHVFLKRFPGVEQELRPFPTIESFWLNLHILLPPGVQKDTVVWFPSPTEISPLHRLIASLIRNKPLHCNVTCGLYSTQMDNPLFVRDCLFPEEKRRILDECFVSQRSLWEYEHKYFLYEGRCVLA
jgi:hypothetical protein